MRETIIRLLLSHLCLVFLAAHCLRAEDGIVRIHEAAGSEALPGPSPAVAGSGQGVGTANNMIVPKGDIATEALLRSVSDPNWAAAQFNATHFPEEKQPESIRRDYVEVHLQRALFLARTKTCGEAMDELANLGQANDRVPFTFSKFSGFLKEAHFQYYMGEVESLCGDEKAARKRWAKVSHSVEPADSFDSAFPYLAAKRLAESDAGQRIQAALDALQKTQPNSAAPALAFTQGSLLLAAGKRDEGTEILEKLSASADPVLQYMSRAMLVEAGH